jgi:hypothetical protein
MTLIRADDTEVTAGSGRAWMIRKELFTAQSPNNSVWFCFVETVTVFLKAYLVREGNRSDSSQPPRATSSSLHRL